MTLDNGNLPEADHASAVLTFPTSQALGAVPPLVASNGLTELPTTAPETPATPTATKQVAIIGYAPSSRDLALTLPEGWEFWGLNQLFQVFPVDRMTRWFEVHDPDYFPQAWPPGYVDWLNQQPFPVVVNRPNPNLKNHIVFPLKRLSDKYWLNGSEAKRAERPEPLPYWTNSIAMMIAMAMDEGYTAIRLYGVDMLQDTEYEIQRSNVEALIAFGRGQGIDIWVAPQATLFRATHIYGFHPIPQVGAIDVPFLMGEVTQLKARLASATEEAHVSIGARLMAQRMLELVRVRGAQEPLIGVLEKEVQQLLAKGNAATAIVAQLEGALLTYERQEQMIGHYRKWGVTPGHMDTGIVR